MEGWGDEARRIFGILLIQSFVGQEIKEEMGNMAAKMLELFETDSLRYAPVSTFGTQAPDMTPAPHEQVPAEHLG